MSLGFDWTSGPFLRCDEGPNRGYSNNKKCVTVVAPMVVSGGVCLWPKSGVRRSVLFWCVLQEFGFSRREDVFTLIDFIKKFYKCSIFSATCKGNPAINYITVQHKAVLYPPTPTRHTLS
jgi:hypothetical protein